MFAGLVLILYGLAGSSCGMSGEENYVDRHGRRRQVNTQPRLTYPSTFTDLNRLTRSLSTLLSKTGFKG